MNVATSAIKADQFRPQLKVLISCPHGCVIPHQNILMMMMIIRQEFGCVEVNNNVRNDCIC